jgi:hypothetical protein
LTLSWRRPNIASAAVFCPFLTPKKTPQKRSKKTSKSLVIRIVYFSRQFGSRSEINPPPHTSGGTRRVERGIYQGESFLIWGQK